MMEDLRNEQFIENEELQEHEKEKDTHRKRRAFMEKKKKQDSYKKGRSKGKKRRFDDEWDEYDF